MGFNIQATIGADGSGFFREMSKIEASAKGLETKAAKWNQEAQSATADRIAKEQRLANLKRGEANLSGRLSAATAGTTEHERLAAALKRVQQNAVTTTREIERLNRTATQAAASSAAAMQQVASVRSGKLKAAAGELGGGLLGGFGGGALGAAGAGIAIAALSAKTIEYGGRISDMAARLGVGTDALQELDYAMELNGATLEDATAAMQKLGMARREALEKGGEKLAAFEALGISIEQLKTARLEDLFKAVGRSVRDAADVQTVLGDAFEVMGKGASNVLAAMRSDLDATGEEARRLGLIIGEDVIAQLDELGDRSSTLGKRMMGAFAPVLTFFTELAHRFMDLDALFRDVFWSLPKRFAVDLYGGATLEDAAVNAVQETQKKAKRLLQGSSSDSTPRGTLRGDAALGFANEGERRATQEAAKLLQIREKIAKLELDALQPAERRAVLERKAREAAEAYADALREQANANPNSAKLDRINELEAKAADLGGGIAGTRQQIEAQRAVVNRAEIVGINNPANAKAQKRMEAEQLKLAQMIAREAEATERLTELNERIARLKSELVANPENPELNRRLDEAKLAKLEAEKELKAADRPEKSGRGFESQQDTDALSKKGLFIGAGPAGVTVAPLTGQQATREFTRMVQAMERLTAVSERGHDRVASAVGNAL